MYAYVIYLGIKIKELIEMKIMTANIDKSIIKDWTGLKDWELQILVEKGYEKAINEMKRRESK